MSGNQTVLELDLLIRRPPESVKAWWTDLPDNYSAADPTEQPFRILTTRRTPQGRELTTYWRLPDGSVRENHEIMRVGEDCTWTFEIPSHPLGLKIFDEFSAKATKDGTSLRIRSTIIPLESAASARIKAQKERMAEVWKRAAKICERDAP
jgi:hypothetical protein